MLIYNIQKFYLHLLSCIANIFHLFDYNILLLIYQYIYIYWVTLF